MSHKRRDNKQITTKMMYEQVNEKKSGNRNEILEEEKGVNIK